MTKIPKLQTDKFYQSPMQFDVHEQRPYWHFFRFGAEGKVSLITHDGSVPELLVRWQNEVRVQPGNYQIDGEKLAGAIGNTLRFQGVVMEDGRLRLSIEDGIGYYDTEGIYAVVAEGEPVTRAKILKDLERLILASRRNTDIGNMSALFNYAYFGGGRGQESVWLHAHLNAEQRKVTCEMAARLASTFSEDTTAFKCVDSARYSPSEMEAILPDVPRKFVDELAQWI